MALFSNLLLMVAENSEQVLNCFKNGGGISYASFKKFHKWMNEFSSKRHEATLLNNFIPSIKGAFIAYRVSQKIEPGFCGFCGGVLVVKVRLQLRV